MIIGEISGLMVFASVRPYHHAIAWILIFSNGFVGFWALGAHFLPRLRHKAIWVGVVAAELVIVAQTILGAILQNSENLDPDRHQLYGFSAFISVGLIYAYRNEMKSRIYLLYGLGSLWIMGLGIRAVLLSP